MSDVYDELRRRLEAMRIETRTDLGFDRLTTIGTGGGIRLTVLPDTRRKLVRVIRLLRRASVPYAILGRGSNVLAGDGFFDGVAVVTVKCRGLRVRGRHVYAQCGTATAAIASVCAERGLSGGEFLTCLPATIGGATVGNAGCFGQDMSQVVRSVTVLAGGKISRIGAKKCRFGKRNSIFKGANYVILGVKMAFARSSPERVKRTIADMRRKKAETQPLGARSAGCVLYHRSVAVSALIDEMGLKGYSIGGAKVSDKHAGFVLNVDKSTSTDIYLLIEYIKAKLLARYGIRAETELALINFTEHR